MLNGMLQKADVLPDSRARDPKRVIPSVYGDWIIISCASCSREGGRVLAQQAREDGFAFWLCNDCFGKYGELTNMMVMPDELWWSAIQAEQVETYGRVLSFDELSAVVEAGASPLATLVKTGRTTTS